LPDERLGQRLVVISEREPIHADQWQRLQHAIRELLGPYAVPKECLTVDQFAETPTGKVDQKATVAQMR
jgi:O-succinylbenzoic acid--CoA ligase